MMHVPTRTPLFAAVLLMVACSAQKPSPAPTSNPSPVATVVVPGDQTVIAEAPGSVDNEPAPMTAVEPFGEDASVFKISSQDPAVGRPDALVTLVVFGDIQCPFTARFYGTLDTLRKDFREDELRVVWKHLPLPFHKEAAPAAEAAAAIYALGGSRAFYCALGEMFDNQRGLTPELYRQAATRCGVNPDSMAAEVRSGNPRRKVEQDARLAADTGTTGTPNSYVNGLKVSGAQPTETVASAVRAELIEARRIASSGTPPMEVHAARVAANYKKDAPRARSAAAAPSLPDTTIFKVPVGQSPVLGSPNALVTVVMFQDFQCPFCQRAVATIEQLRQEFPQDVRVVFKHNPLPFHNNAMAAAQLTVEAKVQQGDAGFWRAYDAIFAGGPRFDDAALEQIAQQLKLNMHAVRSAMSTNRHRAAIEADMSLAKQVGANGTPTFFINGRKLVGAQPIEKFRDLVNEVLPAARALNQRGIPRSRVYAETIKNGQTVPPNP